MVGVALLALAWMFQVRMRVLQAHAYEWKSIQWDWNLQYPAISHCFILQRDLHCIYHNLFLQLLKDMSIKGCWHGLSRSIENLRIRSSSLTSWAFFPTFSKVMMKPESVLSIILWLLQELDRNDAATALTSRVTVFISNNLVVDVVLQAKRYS